jgi:hypothetical protein
MLRIETVNGMIDEKSLGQEPDGYTPANRVVDALTDSHPDMELAAQTDTVVMPREAEGNQLNRVNITTNLALIVRHIVKSLGRIFRLDQEPGKRALKGQVAVQLFDFIEEAERAGIRPEEPASDHSKKVIDTIAAARLSDDVAA